MSHEIIFWYLLYISFSFFFFIITVAITRRRKYYLSINFVNTVKCPLEISDNMNINLDFYLETLY